MRNSLSLNCILIANCLFSISTSTFAQKLPESATPEIEVEKDCDIVQTFGGYYRIEAELPKLKLGSKARVTLNVHNAVGKDIEFGTLFSGCSCLKTTLSSTQLPANGTLQIVLELKVPAKARALEQVVPLNIMKSKDDKNDVSVLIKYHFDEISVFADSELAKFASEKSEKLTFRERLIVSNGIKASELKLLPSDQLKDVKLALESKDGDYFVVGEIATKNIGKQGTLGELFLERDGHGVQDSLLVSLLVEPTLSIVPDPITLLWDDNEKMFRASILVRHNNADVPQRLSSNSDVVVNATCENATVNCKSRKLGAGFAKVSIELVPKVTPDEFRMIENKEGLLLHVKVGGESFQTKCRFRFSGVP